jgi:CRP-like cAMP-binding protein
MVKIFKQGDAFGEIALITNQKRTATIVCKEDCHLLALNKSAYNEILSKFN